MGHKILTHCSRSLIWLALLRFQTIASPCPGAEPDVCNLVQQFNSGTASVRNTDVQSFPATNGDATAAPETPPLDQGERGSSVAKMTCSPPEKDQTCGEEESAQGFKPTSSTPCENLLVNRAEGGTSIGAFQSGGSSRIALEEVPSFGCNGNPSSAMAEDQVLQAQNHQLPLQQGSETEQPDVCLPALEQAMVDESAWNSESSLILLPTETADQSMQSGQECRPSTTTDGDSIEFGAELRKGTNRPESGQPSRQHNAIPLTEILDSMAEGTMTSEADASDSQERDLGLDNKDISASGEFQAPAATSGGSEDGGGAFEDIDSDDLMSILLKDSGTPGSGAPSKGHN